MGHYDDQYERLEMEQRGFLNKQVKEDKKTGNVCLFCNYTYTEHDSNGICPTSKYKRKS